MKYTATALFALLASSGFAQEADVDASAADAVLAEKPTFTVSWIC